MFVKYADKREPVADGFTVRAFGNDWYHIERTFDEPEEAHAALTTEEGFRAAFPGIIAENAEGMIAGPWDWVKAVQSSCVWLKDNEGDSA